MAQYEFDYAIFRGDDYLGEGTTTVSLTKKDIKALEDFIIEHEYSPEFVDIPSYIYDKCCRKAWDVAPRLCKELDIKETSDIDLYLCKYIPASFINVLEGEIINKLTEKRVEMDPDFAETVAEIRAQESIDQED